MTGAALFMLISQLLGGLALFIYGMFVSSDSLQKAADQQLKTWLYRLTSKRTNGLAIGTAISLLIHSGPVMIMLIGFVNAGIFTLEHSIPVMLGANLGTTLSMQLISFDIAKYSFGIVALGFFIRLASKKDYIRYTGLVIFGFGLLFLGMEFMKEAVAPLKDSPFFETVIRNTNSSTVTGMLLGLAISTFFTFVLQSSGAMIGIFFALAHAGVFTSFEQVFALILGAHIGTCTTALFGAIGTHISAKRTAYSHLAFNVLGAILAMLMFKFYNWLIPYMGGSLARQIANAHTAIQLVNALIFLPLTHPFAKLVVKLSPSTKQDLEKSHLDEALMETPEKAILAALQEIRRMASIARAMFQESMRGFLEMNHGLFTSVKKDEETLDILKSNIKSYLLRLAERDLSRRQSILIQYLMTATNDLERIGDHIENVADLTNEKMKKGIWFDDESMADLIELFKKADHILKELIKSFEPAFYDNPSVVANMILEERNNYVILSNEIRARYNKRILEKKESALSGFYFFRYIICFNKLVKHSKTIAVVEKEPFFFLKKHKLEKRSDLLNLKLDHGLKGNKDRRVKYDKKIFEETGE